MKISRYGEYPTFQYKVGVSNLTGELHCLRKSPTFSAHHFATILLMPDYEGHEAELNDNSCGVMQQTTINKNTSACSRF